MAVQQKVVGLAAPIGPPDGVLGEEAKRKNSLRREKVKWAGRGRPALPGGRSGDLV
jgi:hypothetical protein